MRDTNPPVRDKPLHVRDTHLPVRDKPSYVRDNPLHMRDIIPRLPMNGGYFFRTPKQPWAIIFPCNYSHMTTPQGCASTRHSRPLRAAPTTARGPGYGTTRQNQSTPLTTTTAEVATATLAYTAVNAIAGKPLILGWHFDLARFSL